MSTAGLLAQSIPHSAARMYRVHGVVRVWRGAAERWNALCTWRAGGSKRSYWVLRTVEKTFGRVPDIVCGVKGVEQVELGSRGDLMTRWVVKGLDDGALGFHLVPGQKCAPLLLDCPRYQNDRPDSDPDFDSGSASASASASDLSHYREVITASVDLAPAAVLEKLTSIKKGQLPIVNAKGELVSAMAMHGRGQVWVWVWARA